MQYNGPKNYSERVTSNLMHTLREYSGLLSTRKTFVQSAHMRDSKFRKQKKKFQIFKVFQ